jgi:hypothetical protein
LFKMGLKCKQFNKIKKKSKKNSKLPAQTLACADPGLCRPWPVQAGPNIYLYIYIIPKKKSIFFKVALIDHVR